MTKNLISNFLAYKQWIALSVVLLCSVFISFYASVWTLQPSSQQPPLPKAEPAPPSSSINKIGRPSTPSFSLSSNKPDTLETVSNNARIVAPELQPNWTKGTGPMHRVRGIEIPDDPRRRTARRYEGTIVLGAGLYKVRYGRKFIKIELTNIKPLPFRKKCRLKNGEYWHCGGWIRRQVARMLQFKPINCNIELPPAVSTNETYPAQCWWNDMDIAHILVREGWAIPRKSDNKILHEFAKEALRLSKGMWREH